jgi:hypothetical protein
MLRWCLLVVTRLKRGWELEITAGSGLKLSNLHHGLCVQLPVDVREQLPPALQVFVNDFSRDSLSINQKKH